MKYLLIIFVIFLASCARGPEKARKRIAEYRNDYPQLFQDSVIVDTVKTTVSVQIPSKPIDVGVIDSLLEEYCTPDTVERLVTREKIKDRIRNICKLSAVLPIETIHKFEQGIVKIRVNDREELSVDLEVFQTNTTKTTFAPCPEPLTIWGNCLAIWPILAILILIIVAQNVLKR